MNNLLLFDQLNSDLSDSFFPDWIDVPLSHQDKVLLTIRMAEGNLVSSTVLENLTPKGIDVYNSLFSLADLPDEILENIILTAKDMKELLQLRSGDLRIRQLSDKLVNQLYIKFNNDVDVEVLWEPETFDELLEWYERTHYNTPGCGKYHDISDCVVTAILTDNFTRFKNLDLESVLNDYISCFELISHKKYDWLLYIASLSPVYYHNTVNTMYGVIDNDDVYSDGQTKTQEFIEFLDKLTDMVSDNEEYLLTLLEGLVKTDFDTKYSVIHYILTGMLLTKLISNGYLEAAEYIKCFIGGDLKDQDYILQSRKLLRVLEEHRIKDYVFSHL